MGFFVVYDIFESIGAHIVKLMEHLKTVLDIFRTNNIILYILFISSTIITFDLLDMREKLGLNNLDKIYLPIIGMIFLVSISCIFFLLINFIFKELLDNIKERIDERKLLKTVDDTLNKLSNSEKCILGVYYFEGVDTTWLPIQGPEITSLLNKNIIYMSSKIGRGAGVNIIFHYSINPIIKAKVLSYLEIFFGEASDEDIARFYDDYNPKYMERVNILKDFV
ncbi:super-infection exclusion protein B [Acinetobacter oleivorans]|uniref:super-infection exclusion protein B n=1 Tax=Acinetobacter oleivorans TaxID=1148157 RepID=UPI00124FCE4C|nr:super-infection exclusion protein B [Acinetobacter oleivorans]